MKTEQNRTVWIDIVKGIAIIAMIIGHSFGKDRLGVFIFSFHMPVFFILSGYTIKKISVNQLSTSTFKDFKRLIIPVFIVLFIDALLQFFYLHIDALSILKDKAENICWGTLHHGIGKLWFLVALFWGKFFFRIFINITTLRYREIFLLVGSFLLYLINIQLPQNFDLMFIILLFMDVGYHLKNSIDDNSIWMERIGIAVFFIWIYLVWEKNVYIDLAVRLYPVLSIICALCGSLCIMQLSKFLENFDIFSKIFSFLGRHSLELLCIHQLNPYFYKYSEFFSFNENLKLSRLNPYLHCFINVLINIAILITFLSVKEFFTKVCKKQIGK